MRFSARARPTVLALLAFASLGEGCAGPRRGRLGEMRGRTRLIAEAEEEAPPPLSLTPEKVATGFPLYFRERTTEREVLEVFWPLYESGHSSESSYVRLRPFLFRDRFRDQDVFVLFPFWWHLESVGEKVGESRESRVHHFWPFYGVHRRVVDLAPATTHHVIFPIASLRLGSGRWKGELFPAVTVSSGYLDRGWWLLPVLKMGTGRGGWDGGNRFFYLLDPLVAYERFSIAGASRAEQPGDVRTEFKILGGLLGWESSPEGFFLRFFWLRLGFSS